MTVCADESTTEQVLFNPTSDTKGDYTVSLSGSNNSKNRSVNLQAPGFGVTSVAAAIVSVSYLLRKRIADGTESDDTE